MKIATIALSLGLIFEIAAHAAVLVPGELQMQLFVNIWKLDRNVDPSKRMTLAIVYQEDYADSKAVKDEIVAAVERLKLPIDCLPIDVATQQRLSDGLREGMVDVVYVTPIRTIDVGEIARICRARRLRSFTGVPDYVDSGVGVGIGMRKNRPLIIINLGQARAEGAAFSSQLLELARIVGPQS